MTTVCPTPENERLAHALHLLLYAAGYAPVRTWAVPGFLFVTFRTEEKAREALNTFQHVGWVLETELKQEQDGTPYIIVRH